MDVHGDPYYWSVDQVVAYFCESSFASAFQQPDVQAVAQILRENDISGDVLLSDVDKATLKDELAIRSFGQRAKIHKAILYLRGISQAYRQNDINGPCEPTTPLPSTSSALLGLRHSINSPATTLNSPMINTLPQREPEATPLVHNHQPQPPRASPARDPLPAQNEDEGPRKKRRLDLSQLHTEKRPSQSHPEKRLSRIRKRYMPQRKFTLHDIYYGDEEDSDEEDFLVEGKDACRGQRIFVNHALKAFHREPPQIVKARGKPAIARFPFRNHRLPPGTRAYFTLFSEEDGKTVVTKESLSDWPEFQEKQENPFHDYLLKKYAPNKDDEPLPAYGDSGSEGGYDSDLMREIEEERSGNEGNEDASGALSSTTIDSIIDESIIKFEEKFRGHKLPQYQRKAWGLWRRSHRANTVRDDIKRASQMAGHLSHRINEIRKKIHANQWYSTVHVSKQCVALEPTIYDREEQKWKISVLESRECPPRAELPTGANVPKKSRPVSTDGDESLSSDGGLSDFVVSDDDQPPTADNLPTDNLPTDKPIQPATRTSPTPRHGHDAPAAQAHEPPSVPEAAIPEPPSTTISDDMPKTLPDPEEDGEDDIRTALRRMTRRTETSALQLKATPTQKPSTELPSIEKQTPKSAQSRQPLTATPIIDLTLDDDDDVSQRPRISSLSAVNAATQRPQAAARPPVHEDANKKVAPTRLPNPAATQPTAVEPAVVNISDVNSSEVPEITNVEKILRIPIAYFERCKDSDKSDRLLARILYGLRSNQRDMLDQAFTAHCGHKRLRAAILNGASKLLRRHLKSAAISQPSQLELLARCYTSWVNTRDIVFSPAHIPPNFSISEFCTKNKLKKFVRISLICLEAASKLQGDPVEEIEDITDLDELDWEDSADTPHSKKRKRKVAESAEAMDIQRTAQRRVEDQEKQQRRLARKLERMGVSNEDPERQAVSFAPELYLHPHIGRRVKPHQLKGIQFLFREIVKDKRHQGALLAHTMGLGKTMQVISLLVTLAIAGGSEGSQKQIPEQLRESRSLVLCPSSLIENWFEECLMWIPHDTETQRLVGQVRKVTSLLTPFERISTIQRWYSDGGILLLSYDIFRELVINKKKRLGEDSHATVRQQLLQGPKIIVADEAHKFKNRSTGLSSACAQFKSTSRIALTGSPLSNHLEDYYAMIDWIAPGYLGDFVQFKAKYMEPIESGLYADSTRGEKRLSLRKLAVLKRDLDPKVQRADITAIADDLPPKTEFVVTVPLTELQKQAYNSYIESLFLNKVDDIAQTKLWDWLAILSLLCNHPACFMKKLEDRRRKLNLNNNVAVIHDVEDKSGVSDIEENSISSGDRAVSEMPATATERLQQIFSSVPDIMSPSHSHRMQAVELIIRSSIEVGDKVLIFSHSIPTLDYMENMLKGRVAYSRLDGKTPISSRQAATKDFNMENSTTQVYLISMKAGGLGLNIPGANRVIILDFGFNPSWEEQAVGRAYRLGQKKSVYVYRFLAGGTFETKIHNRAIFKTQLSSRVVDKRDLISWATKSNKEYLHTVEEVPLMDTLDTFAGKDKILDKILEQHIVRQLELTETFQKESNEVLTPEEQKAVEDEYADEQLKRNDYAAWLRKNTVVPARPPQPSTPITSAHPPASAPALAGPQAASTMGTMPQMAPPQWAVAGPIALQPDMSASLPFVPPTLNGPIYTPPPTISATGPPIFSLQAHTHPIAPPPGLVPQPSQNDNDVQMGNT